MANDTKSTASDITASDLRAIEKRADNLDGNAGLGEAVANLMTWADSTSDGLHFVLPFNTKDKDAKALRDAAQAAHAAYIRAAYELASHLLDAAEREGAVEDEREYRDLVRQTAPVAR